MGRRKSTAAFSLFSFQDIITSVTAILVLVMLLLTVELVSRRRSQAATDPEVTRRQIVQTAARLESVVSELQREVATRRAEQPRRSREVADHELARLVEELQTTRLRLEETLRTRRRVEELRLAAEAQLEQLAADVQKIAELEEQIKADQEETTRLEASNRKEGERLEKRRQQVADASRSGTELVYNPPAESDRRAWLVELSSDGARVVLLGGDRAELLGHVDAAGDPVRRWIKKLDTGKDYCLLLIRPSASAELESNIETQLRDAGIRFGLDLIGEDQTVRDGSKTATSAP
jgi:hypothetical protein